MSLFADTSLLCALWRVQDNSASAWSLMAELTSPVTLSTLVLLEFRQSTRLQSFRFSCDRTQGWSSADSARMLAQLDTNLAAGAFILSQVDWTDVHSIAERLSAAHTEREGYRTLDVLHVATALHLRPEKFLTLDQGQATLARAAGLKVPTRLRRTGGQP